MPAFDLQEIPIEVLFTIWRRYSAEINAEKIIFSVPTVLHESSSMLIAQISNSKKKMYLNVSDL